MNKMNRKRTEPSTATDMIDMLVDWFIIGALLVLGIVRYRYGLQDAAFVLGVMILLGILKINHSLAVITIQREVEIEKRKEALLEAAARLDTWRA